MTVMTSFHAEKCCRLVNPVNAHTASAQCLCSIARQFLILWYIRTCYS